MKTTRPNNLRASLLRAFPESAIDRVEAMMRAYPIHLGVKLPRNRIYGNYQPPTFNPRTGKGKVHHTITVNIDLNKYEFLFVFLHEYAHLLTRVRFEREVKSHGNEWKAIFKRIAMEFVDEGIFPADLSVAIRKYFVRTPASHDGCELSVAMKKYNP